MQRQGSAREPLNRRAARPADKRAHGRAACQHEQRKGAQDAKRVLERRPVEAATGLLQEAAGADALQGVAMKSQTTDRKPCA